MEQNSVLVVGKQTQLGSILQLQITSALQKKGLISTKDQVTFCTDVQTEKIIARRKTSNANYILLVGLKSHVLPECIQKIDRNIPAGETVNYLVIAPEGQTPVFSKEISVETYQTVDIFTEKMAA